MRILWLSPWMRPLARVHAESLADRGHEVLLVTTDQHPESDEARDYELVMSSARKDPRSWASYPAALRRVRGFDADVAVAELVRDPRWTAFAAGRPVLTVVHDDRPHDAGEHRPRWERALFDRWSERAAGVVAFSEYVARQLPLGASVVPLTSDLDDTLAEIPLPPDRRRDIVLAGRLRPYKNVEVVLAAWRQHVEGPGWRGDDLVLLGDGAVPAALPEHVVHRRGEYRYRDVLPVLRQAKASLVHYRQASQSGVQVLAMQLGVAPVISPVGGLPEYQPPGGLSVEVDDVSGLAAALDTLAEPSEAAARGAVAREHYLARMSATVVAEQWELLLTGAVRRRARTTR